jgi:hypothetical protein
LALGLSVLAGCLTVAEPMPPGGSEKDREGTLGIICEAELQLAGAFQLGAPQPNDVFGCWPVGTWTMTATIMSTDCKDPPQLAAQYQMVVMRDVDDNQTYTLASDPSNRSVRLQVTSGGGGLCEGSLQIYNSDGTQLVNLSPSLQADSSINGHGQFELYGSDQR